MLILLHLQSNFNIKNLVESFLFLVTSIVGFITLFLMIRSYGSNPFCNFYLILIIGIISFRFFVHGSYSVGLQSVLRPDAGLSSILYLIIVPCAYLYYKNLILQKKRHNIKDLRHLIFVLCLYFINSNVLIRESLLFHFGMWTNFFLITSYILFYLILTFKLLKSKIWFRKSMSINNEHFNLIKSWTLFFYLVNLLCGFMVIVSVYNESFNGSVLSGKTMAIFSLTFWLISFFKILISPEILFGLPTLNQTLSKFHSSTLENMEALVNDMNWSIDTGNIRNTQDKVLQENIKENIAIYVEEVNRLSTAELIFRNPKASQSEIALSIGVPKSHIVFLFKYHSSLSFSEFRMNSRVQDAIKLIEGGFLNTETLESLAHTTGFASYNPFFSAFKRITEYAPQEYVKVKKDLQTFTRDDKVHSLKL